MIGIEGRETMEQSSPVVAAPVFGLNFCAYADGEDGTIWGVRSVQGGLEVSLAVVCSVWVRWRFQLAGASRSGVPEFGEIAGETCGFGFEGLLGLLPAAFLHVFGEGNADEAGDSAETEEFCVAASATRRHGLGPGRREPRDASGGVCHQRARSSRGLRVFAA